MKVCHLTSVHESTDDRIFLKECVSLAKAGYETYLVSYGDSSEEAGVHIIGIGRRESSRLKRIFNGSKRVYREALKLNADVYHFHDPELLPYGKKLKRQGKKVIYDSHEDVPKQIMVKEWIPKLFRVCVSFIFGKYEKFIAKKLDCVIAATPHIAEEFAKKGACVQVIKNYPILRDIRGKNEDYFERDNVVCYAGGLTEQRGITDIISAMEHCSAKLLLAGEIEEEYKKSLSQSKGYEKTEFLGFLDRKGVENMYNKSRVGLCVLRKTPNHVNALAIKLFEYMAAGIPIVCSDFPLWLEIVEKNKCGICIEPQNKQEIADAVRYLLDNPEEAKAMGDIGKRIVKEKYNWEIEEKKLIEQYHSL